MVYSVYACVREGETDTDQFTAGVKPISKTHYSYKVLNLSITSRKEGKQMCEDKKVHYTVENRGLKLFESHVHESGPCTTGVCTTRLSPNEDQARYMLAAAPYSRYTAPHPSQTLPCFCPSDHSDWIMRLNSEGMEARWLLGYSAHRKSLIFS